jgi:hypothetical protein
MYSMKTTFFFRTYCLLTCLLLGAASVHAERREFVLRGFDRLVLGNEFIIDIKQGTEFKVSAHGAPRDLTNLEAVMTGRTLAVRFKNTYLNPSKMRIRLSVVMPVLRGLALGGESNATVEGFENQDAVDLALGGGSKAKMKLSARKMRINVAGASELTLSGEAEELSGTVSGASEVRGFNFEIRNAKLNVMDNSNAHVLVTKALLAEATGSSNVRYRGGAILRASTSATSSVRNE